jgi:hypothetical protein
MQSPVGGGWLVTKTNSTTLLLKGQVLKLDQMLLRSAMRVVNLSYHAAVGTSLSRSRIHHSTSELQISLLNSRERGNTMVPHEDSKKQFVFSRNSLLSRVSVSVHVLIQWFFALLAP